MSMEVWFNSKHRVTVEIPFSMMRKRRIVRNGETVDIDGKRMVIISQETKWLPDWQSDGLVLECECCTQLAPRQAR